MAAHRYLAAGTGTDGSQLWVVTVSGQDVSATELSLLYPATPAVIPDPANPGQYLLGTVANDADPQQFTNFGGGTLFVASGLHTGRELFFSDGTAAGTHLVKDLQPGFQTTTYRRYGLRYSKYTNVESSTPTGITAVGDHLAVFTASDPVNSAALFTTDGTAAGTVQITQGGLYSAQYLTAFGDSVLFTGTSSANPGATGLWITDGTDAGTHAIAGPDHPGRFDSALPAGTAGTGFTVTTTADSGAEAFFAAASTASGTELWVTDGTDAGTRQVADINPGAAASSPSFITALGGGRAVFTADDGVDGRQLWATDGTTAGTGLLRSIGADTFQFFSGFTTATIGGTQKAFFVGFDDTTTDPWVTDGTAAGTIRLLPFANAYAGNFTAFSGRMFFTAADDTHGTELWVSDGTAAGTVLFDDLAVGATGASPHDLHVLGEELVFSADDGSGDVMWATDGTLAGTHAVAGAPPIDLASLAQQELPCFARGTRLLSPAGPVAVDDLREGDLLTTRSGAAVPVVWVGQRELDCRRHPNPEKVWPVRVRAGAFGPAVPTADVLLSPDHAILVEGVLIPVSRLTNGRSIAQERVSHIQYFHVELPLHDVLLAEGLPVESFLDTGNRAMFEGQPALRLHPDFARMDWESACAPLVLTGPVLDRTIAKLHRRAGSLTAIRPPAPAAPRTASPAAAAGRW